ncbi:MAG: flagellar hook-associated protein FlgL [Acidiferrobacterales bacterium]
MRISTSQIYDQSVNAMLTEQSQLNQTELQLSSGKSILNPSDNPAGSAQIVNLNQSIATTAQYQTNVAAANARLSLENSTLTSVTNLLQSLRSLAVEANNATQSSSSRAAIAQQVSQGLQQLAGLANTQDANGEYIFAGYQGKSQPFITDPSGNVIYNGGQNSRYLQIGPTTQVAFGDTGSAVFQAVRNGNGTFVTAASASNTGSGVIDTGSTTGNFVPDTYTIAFSQATSTSPITYTVTGASSGVVATGTYTSGNNISFNGAQVSISGTPANGDSFTVSPSQDQSIFTTLQNFVSTLNTNVASPSDQAQVNTGLTRTISEIDQGLNNINQTLAQVGSRLNTVTDQQNTNQSYSNGLQQTLSGVQDLNYASAISQLSQEQLALQAAQEAFAKVQGMSLFNYLR